MFWSLPSFLLPSPAADKVNSGQLIEMRELLADNIARTLLARGHAWTLFPSLRRSCKTSTQWYVLTDNLVLLFPLIYGHHNSLPHMCDQLIILSLSYHKGSFTPWRSWLAGLISSTSCCRPIFTVEHLHPKTAGVDHVWPWHQPERFLILYTVTRSGSCVDTMCTPVFWLPYSLGPHHFNSCHADQTTFACPGVEDLAIFSVQAHVCFPHKARDCTRISENSGL